ncbi:MAG: endonuclease/exonuclease/phosphatase family protein [Blautia sp.]|nr:endonuclease/exonuclease/phosphatase family protein [Blautia sp.]
MTNSKKGNESTIMKHQKNIFKTAVKVLIALFLALFVIVLGYFAYVLLTYSRIEDKQALEVTGNADRTLVPEPGREYTAVSYNIGFGAYTPDFTFFMDEGKQSRAASKESVIECITGSAKKALEYEPDFVLFQEVDTDATRSYHVNQVEMIDDLFEGYDHIMAIDYNSAYLMYPITEPHGASKSSILTQSRFPVTSSLRRSLPISKGLKKLLDLDRCYSVSRIPTADGKELILINTHLSAYGVEKGQGNAQLEMMFADMKAEYEKGNYVVCGGDLNHDFTGDSRNVLNPGADRTYSWCHSFPDELVPEGFSKCDNYAEGLVSTSRYTNIPYSKDSFTVVLDGFIVSDNVTCTYVQNENTDYVYSDHNPVLMKFKLGQ